MVWENAMEVNITYKREMKHNYLIIEPIDEFRLGYECKMLLCNSIDGLLKFHLKQIDGKHLYYYEITSRQPLSRLMEKQCITSEEIRLLLVHISQTLNQMESYLLKEEQILLDSDYIYVEPDSFFVSLCLIPGRVSSFPDDLGKLLQFILSKVNHQDKESVVLAYSLFQESQKENYGIDDLLKLLTGDRDVHRELKLDSSSEFLCGLDKINESAELREECGGVKRGKKTHEVGGNIGNGTNNRNVKSSKDISNSKNEKNTKNENNTKNLKYRKNIKSDSYIDSTCNTSEPLKENRLKNCAADEHPADKFDIYLSDYQDKKKRNVKLMAVLILLMVLLPAGVWFLYGNRGISLFFAWIIGIELFLAVIFLAALAGCFAHVKKKGGVGEDRDYAKAGQSPWQMVFQDDLEEEYEASIRTEGEKSIIPAEETESGDGNTVLLADLGNNQNIHRLISLDSSGQEIVLSYFPFIIGKQEGIVDFVLAKETVSRLHARIDEAEGRFCITDLNSTNGTKVGGRLLENNESAYISPGEEIYLADQGFRFI